MSERFLKGMPESIAAMTGLLGMGEGGEQTGENLVAGVKYKFLTGIVKEVYSNPAELMSRIAENNEGPLKDAEGNELPTWKALTSDEYANSTNVENKQFFPFIPMNSILAYVIDSNNVNQSSADIICFPFFPPHFSLPVKPGEYVWLLQEDVKGQDVYYWMCRKVGFRQLDDINITHLERTSDVAQAVLKEKTDKEMTSVVHFDPATRSNVDRGNTFQSIQKKSIAYREEFTGEPVPRYAKNCGDLVIQGSNNALISLGIEKFQVHEEDTDVDPRTAGEFQPDFLSGRSGVDTKMDHRKPMSPAIDLCIGRKLTDINKAKELTHDDLPFTGDDMSFVAGKKTTENELYEHMETNKVASILKETSAIGENGKELIDYDPTNCLSRIYISNNKNVDTLFEIPSLPDTEKSCDIDSEDYNKLAEDGESDPKLTDQNDFSSIVTYSTNIRAVAKSTLKIYNVAGGGLIYMSPEGDITLQANAFGSNKGGKIVLEAGGNIRIVPGPQGVLKLGADFGDGRTDNFAGGLIPVNPPGTVQPAPGQSPTAAPLISSAAGAISEPAGSGKESAKIIMA